MEKDIEFTVSDLKSVIAIINVMASRGAILGSELSQIGRVYDKYLNTIEKIKAAKEQSRVNSSEPEKS